MNPVIRLVTFARNLRSKAVFSALEKYTHGKVLDIGGWNFYSFIKDNQKISFTEWVNLEVEEEKITNLKIEDARYKTIIGNGEKMSFFDNSFDTALNIQVLEHTFEPIKMVSEIGRILKKGGIGIFLIPQTSVLHLPPDHYYNFTKYWIIKAMNLANLEIIELKSQGGLWTTTASHFVHFFLKVGKSKVYSTKEDRRNFLFYILLPFMVIYAVIGVPICLIFGLGDLIEDPNNWLVVARKK